MDKNKELLLDDNIDIIIAHYNENLDWIKPYAKNVIIYHKGSDDFPKIECKKRIKLENIGRESHTYLYHIVNNYNTLPKYTLFFQGGVIDHIKSGDAYPSVDNYLAEVKKYGFSCANLFFLIKKDPQINYEGKFAEMLRNGSLKRSPYTFASFYKKLLGKEQNLLTPCFWAANFAVSNNMIRNRTLSFYEKALDLLPKHPNPEEGHYFERSWFSIFNKKLYSSQAIQKLFKLYFSAGIRRLLKIFKF